MRRIITGAAIAAVLALGMTPAFASGTSRHAGSGSTPRAQVSVRGLHQVSSALLRQVLPHLRAAKQVSSQNWGGYAVVPRRGHKFRSISANFTIPNVNCAASTTGTSGYTTEANWVGLDGFNNQTVEQTGSASICEGPTLAEQYVWIEIYPKAPIAYSGTSPGDGVNVSVTYNSSTHKYRISLRDLTSGGFVNVVEPCGAKKCANASAEAVVEAANGGPGDGYNLADFGQTSFTGVHVVSSNGHAGSLSPSKFWRTVKILTKYEGSLMASPSPLAGGTAFYETFHNSA